ncbi:hypothetical protein [Acetobacterium bakii]|nr:hypothetical protein [Acetobacterium bakii]
MSASWRTGRACPIMQPTTIYHCPQDGLIDKRKEPAENAGSFLMLRLLLE